MAFELLLDGTNPNKPHGANVYALNKVFDELHKNLKNEDGFKRVLKNIDISVSNNIKPVGVISTPKILILMLLDKITVSNVLVENSIIAKIEHTPTGYVYSTILQTYPIGTELGLNFNIDNPIQGTYTFNPAGDILISWIEGIKSGANVLRFLNIDNLPFPVVSSKYPVTPSDINFINSNKPLSLPDIEYVSTGNYGGRLFNGVYTIFIAYTDSFNNRTNYIASLNPVTIYFENSTNQYINTYDAELNTLTSKTINLHLSNLSTLYNYVDIGIIYRNNGNDLAYHKKYHYSNTTLDFEIRNIDNFEITSVNDIVIDNLIYTKVNAISKFDNQLLIGNIEIKERNASLQLMANAINTRYVVKSVQTTIDKLTSSDITNTYKDNEFIVNHRTFQPFEVYALYIKGVYLDGSETEAFHIPGRAARTSSYPVDGSYANETATISSATTSLPTNIDYNTYTNFKQRGKIANNVKVFQVCDTSDIPYNSTTGTDGKLGYWENENEYYPTDGSFGTLGGQKVRHHRMPSARRVVEGTIIKLKLLNIIFPSAIADLFQGYKIIIATRTGANNTVNDEAFMTHYIPYTAGGNYHPTPGSGGIIANNIGVPKPINYTAVYGTVRNIPTPTDFHLIAPTIMKFNNPLNYNYIKIQSLYKVSLKNVIYDSNSYTSCLYGEDIQDDKNTTFVTVPEVLQTTIDSNNPLSVNDVFLINETFNCLTGGSYIAKNGHTINHLYSPDGIYCNLDDGFKILSDAMYTDSDIVTTIADINNTDVQYAKTVNETNVFAKVLLMRYTNSVYSTFMSQTLNVVKSNVGLDVTIEISGDSFISGTSVRLTTYGEKSVIYAPYCAGTNFELRTPNNEGVTIYGSTLQPVNDNFFNRSSLAEKELFKNWYYNTLPTPYVNAESKWIDIHYSIPNAWGIGERVVRVDWGKLNSYKPSIIFNPDNVFLSKFPYRIAKSLPITTESFTESWNIFKDDNYQDIDNSKGAIQTIDAIDKYVYVRQEYSLFVYTLKDSLEALGQSISLQSNDIFHNRYEEVISSEYGYINSNSRFNSLPTPFGYYVVDTVNKKVYKITGAEAKDLSIGIITFLNEFLTSEFKNPYSEGDFVLGYNDIDKMVLLTNNTSNNPFTLNIDVYGNTFISFHSYVPTIYAYTTFDLFSIVRNQIGYSFGVYKHNEKYTKCLFYYDNNDNRTPKEDILDTLHNMMNIQGKAGGNDINKILNYISWDTTTTLFDIVNNVKIQRPDATITNIAVYTDTQCTLLKDINKDDVSWYNAESGRNIQNKWAFNNILDAVDDVEKVIINKDFSLNLSNLSEKDYYDMSNIISTFVVVRLIHNNLFISVNSIQYEQIINNVQSDFSINNR